MIEVKNLTKRYGSHTAVSNLSFHIETGQIYGFLGPNGAGKSTTMNIMTGCLAATEGEVTVGGYDIFEDAAQAKRRIGYLPERPPLYLDRTPLEYLAFVGQAKGLTGSALEEQMRRVMAVTQIESVSNRLIKNLSKGYQQRVGIAQALLGDPEVVILDEPTVGLDPKQIMEIRALIQSLGKDHTVELTAEATAEEVRAILAPLDHILEVTTREEPRGRCGVVLETDGEDALCREIFFAFSRAQKALLRMTTAQTSLEEIFLELTAEAPVVQLPGEGQRQDGEEAEG